MSTLMKTDYNYHVTLDSNKIEKEGHDFVIYYKGRKQLVDSLWLVIGEKDKFTKQGIYGVLRGTKGIKKITGEFKDD